MIITKEELQKVCGYPYYQGNLIHSRFAYKIFRQKTLPIGNIVAFRAPMKVETDGMIDLEDVLQHDFIYSDDAISFCWEIPNLDAFGAVCFQRLFNTQIAKILYDIIKKPIEVDGDDILVHTQFESENDGSIQNKGKASVSITYSKNNVALGHTAINVKAGREAPKFAYSTNMTDEQCKQFMENVIDCFYEMVDNIFLATTKLTIN